MKAMANRPLLRFTLGCAGCVATIVLLGTYVESAKLFAVFGALVLSIQFGLTPRIFLGRQVLSYDFWLTDSQVAMKVGRLKMTRAGVLVFGMLTVSAVLLYSFTALLPSSLSRSGDTAIRWGDLDKRWLSMGYVVAILLPAAWAACGRIGGHLKETRIQTPSRHGISWLLDLAFPRSQVWRCFWLLFGLYIGYAGYGASLLTMTFRVGTTCRRPLAVKGSFGTWQPRTEREAT